MTVAQLQTIFWNSANPAYTTVRRIRQMGYLKDFNEGRADSAITDNMILYVTPQGAALLRAKLDLLDDEINPPPIKVLQNSNSRKTLLSVNDVRSKILRAHEDHKDFNVVDWVIENKFRSNPDMVKVRRKEKPLYPDGLMILETPDFFTHCYIEVDSGAETLDQVQQQIEVYHAYIRTDLHTKRFNSPGFRVLVITSGKRRLRNLIERTQQVGISGHFWFTTMDELQPETVFTEKIWRRYHNGQEQLISLGELG